MNPWLDATLPIQGESVAWTGLAEPRLSFEALIANGAYVNVGRLECSLHTGTHVDAPFHVSDEGAAIDRIPFETYVGPARLVRLEESGRIEPSALERAGIGGGVPPRLLIATGRPYDGIEFPESIPTLSPEAAEWLISLGVKLLGVDVPSVDPLDSKALPVHKALFAAGGGVLENLDLSRAEPGDYELFAAPLRLVGADAAPCRALLRRL